jgi:hypothetical protein
MNKDNPLVRCRPPIPPGENPLLLSLRVRRMGGKKVVEILSNNWRAIHFDVIRDA